jgi:hypothetical protein
MARGIRVEISSRGAADILKSAAVAKKLDDMGKKIANAANNKAPEHGYTEHEPFAMESGTSDRAFVNVYTRTELGKRMQAKHSTLTQAIDAGRS